MLLQVISDFGVTSVWQPDSVPFVWPHYCWRNKGAKAIYPFSWISAHRYEAAPAHPDTLTRLNLLHPNKVANIRPVCVFFMEVVRCSESGDINTGSIRFTIRQISYFLSFLWKFVTIYQLGMFRSAFLTQNYSGSI